MVPPYQESKSAYHPNQYQNRNEQDDYDGYSVSAVLVIALSAPSGIAVP